MTRPEADAIQAGDRIVWSSPHPRARRQAGTIVKRGADFISIDWDNARDYPVMSLRDCAFLERLRSEESDEKANDES